MQYGHCSLSLRQPINIHTHTSLLFEGLTFYFCAHIYVFRTAKTTQKVTAVNAVCQDSTAWSEVPRTTANPAPAPFLTQRISKIKLLVLVCNQ